MKTFDITRFKKTMKWSLMTEKKQIIRSFLGVFVSYLLVELLFVRVRPGGSDAEYMYNIQRIAGVCIFIWCLAGGYFTAELFSNLRTKQGRSIFFMLPASNKEKFWSRVALSMFYALVVSTVALIASDLVQMLFTLVVSGRAQSVTNEIITGNHLDFMTTLLNSGTANEYAEWALSILSSIGFTLWLVTSYILGGTFFRKVPVVMTTLVWICLTLILSFIVITIMPHISDINQKIEITFIFGTETTARIVGIIISFMFAFLNLWLAQRMFNRMEVIEKKWSFIFKK